MSKHFLVEDDGSISINGAEVLRSQRVVSAAGVSLPADFGKKQQEKADLLGRRLSDLEAGLERLKRTDEEIRQHATQFKQFIEKLTAAGPE
ncbi:hypothetical protein [Pseudomonas sp. Irchel s3b5]|uniref:hypothetical protein n=1 Tax=Pseudomonas sp. Irchel s3b5 TaxID=2009077 RepID=UPI000BA3550B|nr:hypothetical protein [Pseudomonas sp. Irchel s3b5]